MTGPSDLPDDVAEAARMVGRTVTLPYSDRHEVFCPRCHSPGTTYIPRERWGHCGECGFSWFNGMPRR